MAKKTVIHLKRPIADSQHCLPHAAMNLGSAGGSGLRPAARLVSKLIIEEQMGGWVLYRMDADGGFVGDSWHDSREDALRQVKKEFGSEAIDEKDS